MTRRRPLLTVAGEHWTIEALEERTLLSAVGGEATVPLDTAYAVPDGISVPDITLYDELLPGRVIERRQDFSSSGDTSLPALAPNDQSLVANAGGTFDIVIHAAAGLAGNAAALAAFERAALFWENQFSDPVTINIDAELNTTSIFGDAFGTNTLGSARSSVRLIPWQDILPRLQADASADESIVQSLPNATGQLTFNLAATEVNLRNLDPVTGAFTSPTSGAAASNPFLGVTRANAVALGFSGLGGPASLVTGGVIRDSAISFNSNISFDFDTSDGIAITDADFEAVALHEIGHAIGFTSAVDTVDFLVDRADGGPTDNVFPSVLDMFRLAPGQGAAFTTAPRILNTGAVVTTQVFHDGQFDVSGFAGAPGVSGLQTGDIPMSTGGAVGDGRQAGHFKEDGITNVTVGIMDPVLTDGTVGVVTAADLRVLGLAGWDWQDTVSALSGAPPTVAIDALATSDTTPPLSGTVSEASADVFVRIPAIHGQDIATYTVDGNSFAFDAFTLTNNAASTSRIVSARLVLNNESVFATPSHFFDPLDQDFLAVAAQAAAVGLTSPASDGLNDADVPSRSKVLELTFNDFDPGESISWRIDMDDGAVTGDALIGSLVEIEFDNGITVSNLLSAVTGNADASSATLTADYYLPATVSGAGIWTIADGVLPAITEGQYDVQVLTVDSSGAQDAQTATNSLMIDTTPPVVTVNNQTTSDSTPAITGTVSDGALEVTVDGITYPVGADLSVIGTAWTLQIPLGAALADGTYEVTATSTDAAGNVGGDGTANELTVNTTPVTNNMAPLLDDTSSPTLGTIPADASDPAGMPITAIIVDGSITDPNVPVLVTFQEGDNSTGGVGYTTGAVTIREWTGSDFAGDVNQDGSSQILIGFNEPSGVSTEREFLRGLFEFDLSALVTQIGGQQFNVDAATLVLTRATVGDREGAGNNDPILTLDANLYGFDFAEQFATWTNPSAVSAVDNGLDAVAGGTHSAPTVISSVSFDTKATLAGLPDVTFADTATFRTAIGSIITGNGTLRLLVRATDLNEQATEGGGFDSHFARFDTEANATESRRPKLQVSLSAPESIAVTAVYDTNGTWQFSTNGGATWTGFGSPTAAAARLLGPSDQVRFVPDPAFSGTATFTFRAWDQTTGTAGGIADTTSNGGSTAFSAATDTASITVHPVSDFGDAPTAAQSGLVSSYPTLIADGGASHGVLPGFSLGTANDVDTDGQPALLANGDDTTGLPDDEDGVTFNGPFIVGSAASFDVELTNTAAVASPYLDVWVDFNRDGDWLDAGESVFSGVIAGNVTVPFTVDADASFGNTYARFRLHDGTTALTPDGAVADGEVEDYLVSLTAGTWVPLGPFSATNGQVENVSPNDQVVGALHTVIAHPTNADILYVGSVNGGVWKTTNATAASPNWTPLTDGMPSQSIGALTFDVGDPTSQTVYAGVGRFSSFNDLSPDGRIGNDRIGLLRSTDGGASFEVVDGGGTLVGKNISGVYANGNTIVVSVNTADSFTFGNFGIFRSTDGGATFTQISSGDGTATGLPGGVSYDLVADPANPNTLYTSAIFADIVGGQNGIYKSVNQGATWSKVSSAAIDALLSNNTSNLEIAVGTSNNVYAAVINNGQVDGLFRSGNGGTAWVQMDTPSTNENGTDVGLNPGGGKGPGPGSSPEEIAGGQGNIHFSILADPTNPNIVYVGGDRQPDADESNSTIDWPNSIGATDFTGRLFRGDASAPAGSQFVHLTHSNSLGATGGGTASSSAPHADSREMVFDANGNIIEVDDGGVYRRTNPQSNTGDWFGLIGNLQVTEAHDVAYDAVSNTAITGNQDTGTTYQPTEGAATWVSLSTADGGDVAVDDITLAGSGQSIRYSSFQRLISFRRTTWDSSGNLLGTAFPALTVTSGAALTAAFRTPVELNAINPQRLVIQGENSTYESLNQGDTIAEIGVGVSVFSTRQNAIAYGGRKNGVANEDVLWVGSGSDVFFRSGPGALSLTAAAPTSGTIRDLDVDPDDWASAFVIDSDQIFSTFDEGAAWSDITGNLLDLATNLYSVRYVAGPLVDAVLVGTNLGLFAAAANALGTWIPLGAGLPNALVYDMEYDATDDALVAGTLGRGAWMMDNVSDITGTLFAPWSVNGHANFNRSGIRTLTFNFDQNTTVASATSLNLFNHTTGQSIDVSLATLVSNGSTSVTWDLSAVPLPNGRYTAELPATATTPNLTETRAIEFHKRPGDVDGDGFVNFNDFFAVDVDFNTSGNSFVPGDADGDGFVNFNDFFSVDVNFNTSAAATSLDFGDAPDSATFPTTLANDGARHVITGNTLFLGAARDGEADGQSSADATGDDLSNQADEDGIVVGNLDTGTSVPVTVTANVPVNAVLNGWVDFNQDGDWDDVGEQVFTDQAVVDGPNNLTIAVPLGAMTGTTFARFRITETAGYSYFGLAPNGEVEDYQLTVNNPPLPATAPQTGPTELLASADPPPQTTPVLGVPASGTPLTGILRANIFSRLSLFSTAVAFPAPTIAFPAASVEPPVIDNGFATLMTGTAAASAEQPANSTATSLLGMGQSVGLGRSTIQSGGIVPHRHRSSSRRG